MVTLTAATDDDHGHSTGSADDHTADDATANTSDATIDVVARIIGVVGIVIGVAGVVVAVIARRSFRPTA
jgi:beta-lactamase regulating signal transducer with metallopeptidase domain